MIAVRLQYILLRSWLRQPWRQRDAFNDSTVYIFASTWIRLLFGYCCLRHLAPLFFLLYSPACSKLRFQWKQNLGTRENAEHRKSLTMLLELKILPHHSTPRNRRNVGSRRSYISTVCSRSSQMSVFITVWGPV